MTGHLSLYQILRTLQITGVTSIVWDGATLRTEPPGFAETLHPDLLLTIRGREGERPASKPFTLTVPE
jgi:hypothetical protein